MLRYAAHAPAARPVTPTMRDSAVRRATVALTMRGGPFAAVPSDRVDEVFETGLPAG
eukprot:gene19204-12282_t